MTLRFAHSPCPNDTFLFHAWTHGLVDGPEVAVDFADIDVTNDPERRDDAWDVMKVSYGNLPRLGSEWRLLPAGGALGHDCGPLLLRRGDDAAATGGRLAVPSLYSTAYALQNMWASEVGHRWDSVTVVGFDEIMPRLAAGEFDAGLVIHEARFTYHRWDLAKVLDLGEWWESNTGVPIPLGAIVMRRSLDHRPVVKAIRRSLEYARAHPDASADYIARHAQEMDAEVCRQHIALYVNDFSHDLGRSGRVAVRRLLATMDAEESDIERLNADLEES
ncbi:1,4-dihydroxy-6-naphthoate synthase [Haloglycomyces albus]|uniref:1,4-dihydroxy-6-naphthoate synthase n=1 Tax=Haloglycomyces albus TaxID=526067 RepID=UPI001FDEE299|nr:1,4-dihydroxy-6-naphthoate synthase [Haloglycomyces albus]